MMSKPGHNWVGHKNPNTPDDFGEWVEYCSECGLENPGSGVDLARPEYCCACGGFGILEGDQDAPEDSIRRCDAPCPHCQEI